MAVVSAAAFRYYLHNFLRYVWCINSSMLLTIRGALKNTWGIIRDHRISVKHFPEFSKRTSARHLHHCFEKKRGKAREKERKKTPSVNNGSYYLMRSFARNNVTMSCFTELPSDNMFRYELPNTVEWRFRTFVLN